MTTTKLKKTSWGRRRFIKSEALPNLSSWSNWGDANEALRQRILSDSTYQMIGQKMILSLDVKTEVGNTLIEVLGIPRQDLAFLDMEPTSVLVYELEESPFDVDFLTVKKRAMEIMKGISYNLEDNFHIVAEGEKLGLHFFLQKDYIQS